MVRLLPVHEILGHDNPELLALEPQSPINDGPLAATWIATSAGRQTPGQRILGGAWAGQASEKRQLCVTGENKVSARMKSRFKGLSQPRCTSTGFRQPCPTTWCSSCRTTGNPQARERTSHRLSTSSLDVGIWTFET